MGNAFLSHIREADAIAQVTRVFADPDVSHVDGAVNPTGDIETISTELILADLQTIERALPRLEKEARIRKDRPPALHAVQEAQAVLDGGRTVFGAGLDREPLRELFLLTAKPFLYVFNCDADELADADVDHAHACRRRARGGDLPGRQDRIGADRDDPGGGPRVPGRHGPDRVRARSARPGRVRHPRAADLPDRRARRSLAPGPSRGGATAPQAAGVIHTDFQKGFIKAEVVSYDDLVAAGSLANARAKGKVRLEGKDYVMADGDVVEFRFNV